MRTRLRRPGQLREGEVKKKGANLMAIRGKKDKAVRATLSTRGGRVDRGMRCTRGSEPAVQPRAPRKPLSAWRRW